MQVPAPGHPDLERLSAWLGTTLECAAPGLTIVPTTAATLQIVATRKLGRGIPVVGSTARIPFAITPSAFLSWLAEHPARGTSSQAIVFTDQCVAPHEAPLLVTHGGRLEFMPAMEVVANARYGTPLNAWVGEEPEEFVQPACRDDVLRLLVRYYAACDLLGDAWLARGGQSERMPAVRTDTARRRLRLYQSAIFHLHPSTGLPLPMADLARQLAQLRCALPAGRHSP